MNVLILGGSGFVGSYLVPRLIAQGIAVTLLNRGNRGVAGVGQLTADRRDLRQMRQVANSARTFDTLIDLCSYTVRDTEIAFDAFAHRIGHWVHLSSASVYRNPADHPWKELDEIGGAPVWGEYGRQKSDIDRFLLEKRGDLRVTILRPPYLYGPRNDSDRETFVWARALRGDPVFVPGDGSRRIQFLHCEDLAAVIERCLECPPAASAIYNVANAECLTLAEWVARTAAAAGFDNPGRTVGTRDLGYTARQYFPFRETPCVVDGSEVRKELSWQPAVPFGLGLAATFGSYSPEDLRRGSPPSEAEGRLAAICR